KKILNNSKEKSGAKHLQILAAITKLRQLACNPKLVMPDISVESSKMLALETLLSSNHKALIFLSLQSIWL
ncbi:MAG: hypothetical protein MI739_14610, partial [Bacteroidales bacterium]|nr:hypothetical protein [Bacteroidales bacterium]